MADGEDRPGVPSACRVGGVVAVLGQRCARRFGGEVPALGSISSPAAAARSSGGHTAFRSSPDASCGGSRCFVPCQPISGSRTRALHRIAPRTTNSASPVCTLTQAGASTRSKQKERLQQLGNQYPRQGPARKGTVHHRPRAQTHDAAHHERQHERPRKQPKRQGGRELLEVVG